MPTPLIQYELDPTGLGVANLISNELHSNVDTLTGILIPKFGDFFTTGLVIRNSANTILVRDDDYVPIEFNAAASAKYGKEICRGILILTNKSLSPFSITYQVLGGDRSYSNQNLLAVTQEKILPPQPVEYSEIFDVPLQFEPSHHLHDIDEVYGFERIVAALNRVKTAIEHGSFPAFQSLLGFLDSALLKIKIDMNNYLDDQMEAELQKFKDQFTKEFFGIENIPNLRQAFEPDGYAVGNKSFLASSITENKLMTLEALVGLKKIFFESFVRKQMTGLDMSRSVYGAPTTLTVRDMVNRSTITIISRSAAIAGLVPFDPTVYPDELAETSELIILKVSNGFNNGTGDIIGFDQTSKTIYHGNVVQGWSGVEVNWKRNFPYDQLQTLKQTIQAHIEDNTNPHELDKADVGLDKVENLPVVTKQDLDTITSTRKYLTFDSLMYFMRTHLLQNGPKSIVPDTSQNKFLIDNAVVVYAPGGGCSRDPQPALTGLNGTVPANMTIGWSIINGKPNSKFTMTSGLIGREPTTVEYQFNSVGSYIGYLNSGPYPGTIQTLFGFEGGGSILANTIVEANECAIEAPVLVKLSQQCSLTDGETPPVDPYAPTVLNKLLMGTYGYTTTPAGGPNFDQLISDYSCCCGTRDPVPQIQFNSFAGLAGKVTTASITGGMPNSLVEGRIRLASNLNQPPVYFNTTLDETGSASIPIFVGNTINIATLDLLFIYNYPVPYSTPLITTVAANPADIDTVVYLRLSNPNPEFEQSINVGLTVAGCVPGNTYLIVYENTQTNETYTFSNAPPSFVAVNEVEVFNFIVPYSEIDTVNFSVRALIS